MADCGKLWSCTQSLLTELVETGRCMWGVTGVFCNITLSCVSSNHKRRVASVGNKGKWLLYEASCLLYEASCRHVPPRH